MYKVFFNEKLIIISNEKNITLRQKTVLKADSFSAEDFKIWFNNFVWNDDETVIFVHEKAEEFFSFFKSMFVSVPAAGGVVIRDEKLLFIFRNGKWDLPKGKIKDGESTVDAAVREVEEECGISGFRVNKQLPSTFHIYPSSFKKSKGEWIFKETFWYEMDYNGNNSGTPQFEEGITHLKWFSRSELVEVLLNTYENLKQIISIFSD